MGRLIDADANRDDFVESVYEILCDEPDNIKANLIIELFDDMKTAYDVDKVVEEIHEVYSCKDCEYEDDEYSNVCTICYEKKIKNDICKIVRKGGV